MAASRLSKNYKPTDNPKNGIQRDTRNVAKKPTEYTKAQMRLVLSKYSEDAYKQLQKHIKNGSLKAIELWFSYMYGKPEQLVDQNTNLQLSNIKLTDLVTFEEIPFEEIN